MRILLSAYGCLPHRGSEPGIGWNTATSLAEHAEVWVLTKAGNRALIEEELAVRPVANLHFSYLDLPVNQKRLGHQVHYLWWQFAAQRAARDLHARVGFDVAHHVSFVRYWTPSLVARLPIPFIWGPVGGAEATRLDLDLGRWGVGFEVLRWTALNIGSLNPLVRHTAQRSAVSLAASEETQRRVRRLGCEDVRLMSPVGTPNDTMERGRQLERRGDRTVGAPTFTSVTGTGRLLHWKGVHLGIRGFAAANIPDAEFHVFGSGRQLENLRSLAHELGVADRVRLWGDVSRETMLDVLERSHALVHPGIHDPGATVIPEAMSLGVPVLCLDVGGPAILVDDSTGFRAPFGPLDATVAGLADGMRRLAQEPELLASMRQACFSRARERLSWPARAKRYMEIYEEVLDRQSVRNTSGSTRVAT